MGLTRADLIGEMSDEERASRKEWIDRTSSNDKWACKIFKNIGILITGHQANRPYMKACIETHAQLGYWITLAYDNYVNPDWTEIDHDAFMPTKDVLDKVDMFIMPHHQVWGGCLYPWFWLMKFGVDAMQQFEYIYCTNSDFVLEKPEGFPELFKMLDDADIITSGPNYTSPPAANTAGFIAKSSALKAIMKHFQDHFIPWDVYEKYTQEIGNTEGRFGTAIKDLGLKLVEVLPPIGPDDRGDDMFRHVPETRKQKGTWTDLIGFRHIHSELNASYRYKLLPPPSKYLDPRFTSENDIRFIRLYEETKDINVLKDWWAK
jgi:hypothetical protein